MAALAASLAKHRKPAESAKRLILSYVELLLSATSVPAIVSVSTCVSCENGVMRHRRSLRSPHQATSKSGRIHGRHFPHGSDSLITLGPKPLSSVSTGSEISSPPKLDQDLPFKRGDSERSHPSMLPSVRLQDGGEGAATCDPLEANKGHCNQNGLAGIPSQSNHLEERGAGGASEHEGEAQERKSSKISIAPSREATGIASSSSRGGHGFSEGTLRSSGNVLAREETRESNPEGLEERRRVIVHQPSPLLGGKSVADSVEEVAKLVAEIRRSVRPTKAKETGKTKSPPRLEMELFTRVLSGLLKAGGSSSLKAAQALYSAMVERREQHHREKEGGKPIPDPELSPILRDAFGFEAFSRIPTACLSTFHTWMAAMVDGRISGTPCGLQDLLGVVKRMRAGGLKLNSVSYNILLKCCSQSGQVREVEMLVRAMVKAGLPMTPVTCNTVAHVLFKHGKDEEAMQLLEHLRSLGSPLSTELCTTFLWGLGQSGRVEEAEELFKEMEAEGVPVNAWTVHALMQGWASLGECEQVERVMGMGLLRGCQPDSYSYGILMAAYKAAGKTKEVLEMYSEMERRGIAVNCHTGALAVVAAADCLRFDVAAAVLRQLRAVTLSLDAPACAAVLSAVAAAAAQGQSREATKLLHCLSWFAQPPPTVPVGPGLIECIWRLMSDGRPRDEQVLNLSRDLLVAVNDEEQETCMKLTAALVDALWACGMHRRATLVLNAAMRISGVVPLPTHWDEHWRWLLVDLRRLSGGAAAATFLQWMAMLHLVQQHGSYSKHGLHSSSPDLLLLPLSLPSPPWLPLPLRETGSSPAARIGSQLGDATTGGRWPFSRIMFITGRGGELVTGKANPTAPPAEWRKVRSRVWAQIQSLGLPFRLREDEGPSSGMAVATPWDLRSWLGSADRCSALEMRDGAEEGVAGAVEALGASLEQGPMQAAAR